MGKQMRSDVSASEKVADFTKAIIAEIDDIPDLREGGFAAPTPIVIEHLCKWLNAKYTIDMAYRSFADRVRGPWRDSLVDHWYDHSKDERQASYDLAMRIVALGGDPSQTTVQLPECQPDVICFCEALIEMEVKSIENGHIACQLSGNNGSLKVLAEQVMLIDSHHLDDLRRMCLSCCK